VNGLSRKLSADLLLLLLLSLRRLLLLLLLLRPLQDLRRIMTWRTTMHAREWRLSMRVLLRWVALGWSLKLHLLDRRGASWLVADALSTHHSLDLVQTHQLPRRGGLRCGSWSWRVRLGLVLTMRALLLRLQAPDVGTRFQLRDVLGVLVALVAAAIGLGCLRNRWLVLLGRTLTGLEQHLLLLQDVRDLGCLASEVKVLVNRLLNGRAPKGIVIEGIVGVVEAVAEAVVRLIKVNAVRA
jgi:hypothetical protein